MTKSELSAFIKNEISEAIFQSKNLLDLKVENNFNEYNTINEVAGQFKVVKATVHNWAKKGIIKKYKINGRTLYKISEIESQVNLKTQLNG